MGKRKYGFITRACTKYSFKKELYEQWEICNTIVLVWIMNTICEELLSGIMYSASAFEVWHNLKKRFDKVNHIRIYQFHREFNTFSQGTDSILTYFTKLISLWGRISLVPALIGIVQIKRLC